MAGRVYLFLLVALQVRPCTSSLGTHILTSCSSCTATRKPNSPSQWCHRWLS